MVWERVKALTIGKKIMIAGVAIVLAIALSPVLAAVSGGAFMLGFIILIARLVRRDPLKTWGIAVSALFVGMLVFGSVAVAFYGPGAGAPSSKSAEKDSATQSEIDKAKREADEAKLAKEKAEKEAAEAKEEAAAAKKEAEEAKSAKPEVQPEPKETATGNATPVKAESKPAAPPKAPQTPEDKLRSKIQKTFIEPKDIRNIQMTDSGAGCSNVSVAYNATGLTSSGTVSGIELQMQDVYEAAYRDKNLANTVCGVTVDAYGELVDNLGNTTQEKIYSTSMDRPTGTSINWNNSYAVDFPTVWTLNYMHPAVESQIAQDKVKKAADCANDDGLFDIDIDCP